MVGIWHHRRGPFLQCMPLLRHVILEWMLLEQTHVYGHIFVFLLSDFIFYDNFSQVESMSTFDLKIFEIMLS